MFGFDKSISDWMKKSRGQYEGILGGMDRNRSSHWNSIFGKRRKRKKQRDLIYQQFNKAPSQAPSRRDIHLQNAEQGVVGAETVEGLRPSGSSQQIKARQSLASKLLAATPTSQAQRAIESASKKVASVNPYGDAGSGALKDVLGGLYGKKNVGKVGSEIGRAKKKVKKFRRKAKRFFKKLF